MAHRNLSRIWKETPCWVASYNQAWCKVHNMLYPNVVSHSTLHLYSVSQLPEKWFLVSRESSLQQGLHDHHTNLKQTGEPTPDDVESEQSSHNTKNMNVAESMSLRAARPATERKKWAPLWRACHFYETSSVHLALRLSHCLSHILAHMMNLFLTWCWKQGVWQIGGDKYMVKTRVCFSIPSVPHMK